MRKRYYQKLTPQASYLNGVDPLKYCITFEGVPFTYISQAYHIHDIREIL